MRTTTRCAFFSRGLRHLNLENQARVRNLKPGERLFLIRDLQNEHDAMALLLRTEDPIFLVGYAPRYYSEDFNQVIGLSNQENVKVTVEQVNQDAPIQYRVLCRFASPWPANFHPCAGENFRTLV
ncbi:MAG: HIRAN domain-containing protein [Gammaproteobacteria bacterium]